MYGTELLPKGAAVKRVIAGVARTVIFNFLHSFLDMGRGEADQKLATVSLFVVLIQHSITALLRPVLLRSVIYFDCIPINSHHIIVCG